MAGFARLRAPAGVTEADAASIGPGALAYAEFGSPIIKQLFHRIARLTGMQGGSTRPVAQGTPRIFPWTEEMLNEARELLSAKYRAFSGGGIQRLREKGRLYGKEFDNPFRGLHEQMLERLRTPAGPYELEDFIETFGRSSLERLPAWHEGGWRP